MKYQLRSACFCTTGYIRSRNEDNFYFDSYILPENNDGLNQPICADYVSQKPYIMMGIFDGIGGKVDGQIASYLAAGTLRKICETGRKTWPVKKFLNNAVIKMNDAVCQIAKINCSQMGTTAVMLCFVKKRVYVCNLGDSRAFLFRADTLTQLSKDHTDAEFLNSHGIKRKPRLSQYIGMVEEDGIPTPFISKGCLLSGDQYLLCSDGITDMLGNAEIAAILHDSRDECAAVNNLVSAALKHGGRDNVTAIVIRVLKER